MAAGGWLNAERADIQVERLLGQPGAGSALALPAPGFRPKADDGPRFELLYSLLTKAPKRDDRDE